MNSNPAMQKYLFVHSHLLIIHLYTLIPQNRGVLLDMAAATTLHNTCMHVCRWCVALLSLCPVWAHAH